VERSVLAINAISDLFIIQQIAMQIHLALPSSGVTILQSQFDELPGVFGYVPRKVHVAVNFFKKSLERAFASRNPFHQMCGFPNETIKYLARTPISSKDFLISLTVFLPLRSFLILDSCSSNLFFLGGIVDDHTQVAKDWASSYRTRVNE
jgi:hypothetical protein